MRKPMREVNPAITTGVLVVGAGPAGLISAIGLARYGVPVMLVERHEGTSIFPAATGISPRSMEIMRTWGLEPHVRAREFEALAVGRVAESLVADEGVSFPLGAPTDDEASRVSPSSVALVAQDVFEPVLLEQLRTYPCDIRFGTELVTFQQHDAGVTAVLMDRETGRRTTVCSRFLVAADGGRSSTRSELGIDMVGPDHLEEYVSTLFRAPLTARLRGEVHALNMVPGPAGMAVILPTSGDDRWVFAQPWDPENQQVEEFTEEKVTALIRAATGVADLEVDILSVSAFSFAAQLADRYRVGNTFLVGDAAHRITPRGGTGMNTAIHDAHNLAWKLAFVLKGWADPGLLDTYETERRPVGRRNTLRSAQPTGPDVDALGIDIGITYEAGALAPEVTVAATTATPWRPSGRPGARLPHLWLDVEDERRSTLDLVSPGLTLFSGAGGAVWTSAVREATGATRVPLRHWIVGTDRLHDPSGDFCSLYGIERDGAVLVRPDGHIAWRARSAAGCDVAGELDAGIRAAFPEEAASRSEFLADHRDARVA